MSATVAPAVEPRYIRQGDILPAARMAQLKVMVIGCGAVGSLIAKQLAHIGQPHVTLCDFDTVDEVNLCCQGFTEADLGQNKVDAVARAMVAINGTLANQINPINARFRKSDGIKHDVIFCCVDKIDTRKFIFNAVKDSSQAFFDARVKGGDSIRILSATDAKSRAHYAATLFAPEEVQAGECTAKMTIYGAFVAAGLLVSQYSLFLRRFPICDPDIMINLAGMELAVME
jgi:molybdopterin/thiamine biosynthesis adenylyltransferase